MGECEEEHKCSMRRAGFQGRFTAASKACQSGQTSYTSSISRRAIKTVPLYRLGRVCSRPVKFLDSFSIAQNGFLRREVSERQLRIPSS